MTVVAERKGSYNPHLGDRDTYLEENLGLVHMVCQKYITRASMHGQEYGDIFSVGCIGLMYAYDHYDPDKYEKVNSFTTYAVPSIEGRIKKFFRDLSVGVKYPRSAKEIAYHIRKNGWENKSAEEIAKLLDKKVDHVKVGLDYMKNSKPKSLYQTVHENDGDPITLADQLVDEADFTNIEVEGFLSSLSERDQVIVRLLMLYRTQLEIGKAVCLSQVQVSRILPRIRKQLESYLNGETYPIEVMKKGRPKKERKRIAKPRVKQKAAVV